MIEKGYIDPKQLKSILNNKPDNCRLGDYLIKENIVFEKQMIECLSILNNETYLYEEALKYYNILELSKEYKKSDLIENSVIPLYKNNEVTTFAYCEKSPLNLKERLIAICKTDVHLVLSSYDTIKIGLDIIYGQVQNFNSINIESEIEAKYSVEQVLIIRNYAAKMNNSEENILKKMGLMYADNIFEESKMEYTEELIAET